MPTKNKLSKKTQQEPTLGKRHDYELEAQKSIRNKAVDLGFTAKELEELSKIYKGKVKNF